MKKIFSLVVLISSFSLAQNYKANLSSFEINQSKFLQQESSIQYPVSKIQHPAQIFEKKKTGIAILYSLLLPGMGELYANNYESGRYFTIADGTLWSIFSGFTLYGNIKKNNYNTYAKSNAGIDLEGKDADLIANVGLYMNVDEYNKAMEMNREFAKVYNTNSVKWNWASNDRRKEFRDLWSSSEGAYNKVRFVAGALILNRIVSAINAVRLVSAYNKNLPTELSWNIYFGVDEKLTLPQSLTLNFSTNF